MRAPAPTSRRRDLTAWLFVAPALAYMLLFFGYPLVRNVVMSFQDYTFSTYFTGEAPFNGLENWRTVFTDELFGASLWRTLLFTAGSLLGQFTIGMALALFFSRRFPLSGVMRSLLLLPWLIPMVVAGTVWRRVLDQETGVLNEALQALHLTSSAVPWLSSPDQALLSVILVNIWIGVPFNMVILYGGLQEIPAELREAAVLDGAGPFRMFWSVMAPLVRPAIATVVVFRFVPIWNDFFYPLILIRNRENYTLPVGLTTFFGEYQTDWSTLFAGLVIATLPLILLFLVATRQIIAGLTSGMGK